MILAWLGAIVVGLSLGLLGSGGSILTVPILVYLLGQPDKVAIAGSLAIVGGISLVGAARYAYQRLVSWRHVAWFGIPGIGGSYLGAYVSKFVPGSVQLVVFALIMGLASYTMLRPAAVGSADGRHPLWLLLAGFIVGMVTGFVGVGGGFLIVPALVVLGGLAIYSAVGTSLVVIVMNSGGGFYKHFDLLHASHVAIDWRTIILFIVLGAAGSVAGNSLARRITPVRLRHIFGVFLIAMSGYILWHSLPLGL